MLILPVNLIRTVANQEIHLRMSLEELVSGRVNWKGKTVSQTGQHLPAAAQIRRSGGKGLLYRLVYASTLSVAAVTTSLVILTTGQPEYSQSSTPDC